MTTEDLRDRCLFLTVRIKAILEDDLDDETIKRQVMWRLRLQRFYRQKAVGLLSGT